MSRLAWFQLTLLMIWGVVAMATLSGSFWLTRTDWAPNLNAEAFSASDAAATRNLTSVSRRMQDEIIELREVVMRLDRQNRILVSRLDATQCAIQRSALSAESSRHRPHSDKCGNLQSPDGSVDCSATESSPLAPRLIRQRICDCQCG